MPVLRLDRAMTLLKPEGMLSEPERLVPQPTTVPSARKAKLLEAPADTATKSAVTGAAIWLVPSGPQAATFPPVTKDFTIPMPLPAELLAQARNCQTVCGGRLESCRLKRTVVNPSPSSTGGLAAMKLPLVPHSNQAAVGSPWGTTIAFSVADSNATGPTS